MMMSHSVQPSSSISARVIGRNGAGVRREAQYFRRPNSLEALGLEGRAIAVLVEAVGVAIVRWFLRRANLISGYTRPVRYAYPHTIVARAK